MMPNSGGGGSSVAVSDDGSSGGGSSGGGGGSGLRKGPWTAAEDAILMEYVKKHGEGNWNAVQKNSGLSRCGKSCRLRWANHLRPNLKKGSFSPDEERQILELHSKLGNKWARMAAQLPGRTDNEIKNYWNTRVKRRQRAGLPLYPHDIQKQANAFHLHQNHHHNHNHNHQPRPSPPPPPQLSLQSSQQHKPNFGSPLSLFDPMSFTTNTPFLGQQSNSTPFLNTQMHGFKRFRGNNLGFSNPFSTPNPTMFNQNFSSQLLPLPTLQFNTGSYDFNPSIRSHISPSSSFSMKMELPSNQTDAPLGSFNDYKISPSLQRSNSGLLDAMLQESEAMGGGDNVRNDEENHGLDGFVGDSLPSGSFFNENPNTPPLGSTRQWDDTSSPHSSFGEKRQKEQSQAVNPIEDDDLSSLLDIIPSTMMVSELYNDNGEISNGHSSVVTDDDFGLNLQRIPANTVNHDWSTWNNMPEMC
ncbi:hypothetical protein GIB67_011560 [Kingdonia uniflora]|uniref:Uncharacterized protein n=1 Tax=Kingdonia uniflora TaxID=39325 RepID=A0A7J7NLW1_9MAGN|nr:hypothetical protein GIB67_011560 [Kingdonia uniflora]